MKKFVNVTATILLTICFVYKAKSQDAHINFVDIELDSAYKLAKAENKLVFVDCYTTWCGPCKYMDANIFTKKEVAEYYNDNFINVKLDMEAGEGEIFAGWYEVRSYPTYIFLDLSGRRKQLVHRTVGSMDAERFIQFGRDASDTSARIGEWRNRYSQGERAPDFLKSYVQKLYDAGYSSDAREISFWIYQDLNWNNIDSTDAKILLRFINGNAHPLYNSMIDNLSKLESVADGELLYRTLIGGYMTAVWQGMKSENPSEIMLRTLKKIDELNFSGKEKMKWEIEIFYAERNDLERYLELAPQFAEKYNMDNSLVLNSVAWKIYEKTEDKKILTKALRLVNRSVLLDANYNNLDTKMRILYVLGKKREAFALANEISEMIESNEALAGRKEDHDAVIIAMKSGENIREQD
ncbi:MAG: thioredoxin family protein [Crocinitomicaceae bacterium]